MLNYLLYNIIYDIHFFNYCVFQKHLLQHSFHKTCIVNFFFYDNTRKTQGTLKTECVFLYFLFNFWISKPGLNLPSLSPPLKVFASGKLYLSVASTIGRNSCILRNASLANLSSQRLFCMNFHCSLGNRKILLHIKQQCRNFTLLVAALCAAQLSRNETSMTRKGRGASEREVRCLMNCQAMNE